jgi:hypothetical protein
MKWIICGLSTGQTPGKKSSRRKPFSDGVSITWLDSKRSLTTLLLTRGQYYKNCFGDFDHFLVEKMSFLNVHPQGWTLFRRMEGRTDNFTPRGQNWPLGSKFALGAKLRMGLWSPWFRVKIGQIFDEICKYLASSKIASLGKNVLPWDETNAFTFYVHWVNRLLGDLLQKMK